MPQPTTVSPTGASSENSFKTSYFRRSQQATPRRPSKAIALDSHAASLSKPEAKLANQIQQYRQENGLPAIRLSKALTLVADRHVQDLVQNGSPNALHSWSDAPYNSSNPATYPSMWEAPQRLKTGYSGNGYEIAFWTSTNQAKPAQALGAWKGSPSHNVVILNQEIWQQPWKAMGVGIREGYAVVWFGNQRDRSGQPSVS
ncbi:MAG: CAP domain-containing protein [Leptolyngbyaceae cyanobacterium CSU_1_4]|nr:CAP domain-containing protein [Leptolyngbyaceae cyanobacterium CSU_1_4]